MADFSIAAKLRERQLVKSSGLPQKIIDALIADIDRQIEEFVSQGSLFGAGAVAPDEPKGLKKP